MNSFFSLINAVSEYYSFTESEKKIILDLIFFATDTAFQSLQIKTVEYESNFSDFYAHLENLKTRQNKLNLLKILLFFQNRFVARKNYLPKVSCDIEKLFEEYADVLTNISKDAAVQADSIKRSFDKLSRETKNKEHDRIEIIELIKDFLTTITNFAAQYNSSKIQISIKKLRDEFFEKSKIYTKKKRKFQTLFMTSRFNESHQQFGKFILSATANISKILEEMFQTLDFLQVSSFVSDLQKQVPRLRNFNRKLEYYDAIISSITQRSIEIVVKNKNTNSSQSKTENDATHHHS